MKRIILTLTAVALLAAFTPAQAQAFHGGGCGLFGRAKQGIGRVFGVQRRQGRRAAGGGVFGGGHSNGNGGLFRGGCANGSCSR